MKKRLKSLAIAAGTLATTTSMAFAADIKVDTPDLFFSDMGVVVSNMLRLVMMVGALLVFTYLIWGGIEWITSGGDKGKTESARNKITAAVIGLIILVSAWAILTLILGFLGTTLDELLNVQRV